MKIEALAVGNLATNCYIVYSGRTAVVIDPGAEDGRIFSKLDELGVSATHIFLTHAHFDHVLAASELAKKTGAKLVAALSEQEGLKSPVLSGFSLMGMGGFVPLCADISVSDGDVLAVGDMRFEFLTTPGHTKGSVCILCDGVLFSGDTLFEGSCGRCDLPGGDIEAMLRSLKKLYLMQGDFKVYPGHGNATTLSQERLSNPYMAEAMRR